MGVPALLRFLGGRSYDGRRSGVFRGYRRIFYGLECSHGTGSVESVTWRADNGGPHYVLSVRQTVRRDSFPVGSIRIRAPMTNSTYGKAVYAIATMDTKG